MVAVAHGDHLDINSHTLLQKSTCYPLKPSYFELETQFISFGRSQFVEGEIAAKFLPITLGCVTIEVFMLKSVFTSFQAVYGFSSRLDKSIQHRR